MSMTNIKATAVILSAAVSTLALTACSGAVATGASGSADGFEYGADQATVNEAISDLDPVTLRFQAGAQSEESEVATSTLRFKEYVEERSDGKITIDIVWGTAVAGYSEVFDALADGRLDIAFTVPVYAPAEFPVSDALNHLTQYSPASPVVGEIIGSAVMSEIGWGSQDLLDQTFAQYGVTALSPLSNTGDYLATCADEAPTADHWQGLQTRISSTAHSALVESVGSVPVSLEFVEAYEGLQRGTVDCALVQAQTAGPNGLLEAAPHVYHTEGNRLTGTVAGAYAAGASFAELPLPYQQIVFDAEASHFEGNLFNSFDSLERVITDATAAGGSVQPLPADVEDKLEKTQEELVDALIDEGRLDSGIRETMTQTVDKWVQIVEEEGIEDGGTFADFIDWYDPEALDLSSVSERVFVETALPHRPE